MSVTKQATLTVLSIAYS